LSRREGGRARAALRRALLAAIGVLYALSIPWYRSPGAEPELVFGLPGWVAVALGCYAGAALLNAAAWLLTDVPDAPPGEPGPTRDGDGP
jgi:hypothetical protein